MEKDKINNNYVKDQSPYPKYKNKLKNDVLKLYFQYNHMKNIYRQGWLTHLVGMEHEKKTESIADHSYSVAMLALIIIEKYKLDLNMEKCLKLALTHELGEIYEGDHVAYSIDNNEKHKLELQAIDKLLNPISFENDIKELWLEYDEIKTKEAKFIKQVDKLECIIQGCCYNLNSKYIYERSVITEPCLVEILDEIYEVSKDNQIPLCYR